MADLQDVRAEIAGHLDAIKPLFIEGAKVTLLVRNPSFPDGSADVLMSDDDPAAVVTAIGNLIETGTKVDPDPEDGRACTDCDGETLNCESCKGSGSVGGRP